MCDSQTYVGLPRLSHFSVYGASDFGPKYHLLAERKPYLKWFTPLIL